MSLNYNLVESQEEKKEAMQAICSRRLSSVNKKRLVRL